ncbi:MAG: RagB/SusD family nutrient uptake outer membrane protein [Bacteroidales bacterium]
MKNYIFNKQGRNFITMVIASLIIVFAVSCNKDFLVEKPTSFLGPDNTFNTADGFKTAVVGLYAAQRRQIVGEDYGLFFVGTDIARVGLTLPKNKYIEELGSNVQPSDFGSFWDWGYALVGNANQILDKLKTTDVVWAAPADKAQVEAESRFFRAYAYRVMTYCYGDLPIVTELTKPFRNDFTRQPVAEVQRLIINDLKFAEVNLPETTTFDGKLVKAAAQHYLAEVYLYINKPDSAEIWATKVTTSSNFKLMTSRFGNALSQPGDVFSDLFKENNANRTKGNTEGIWVQQWQYNVIGGDEGGYTWDRRDMVPFYSLNSGFVLADSLGGRGIGRVRPLTWWLNAYESQDIRNSKYNIRRHWYFNDISKPALYGKELPITDILRNSGSLYESSTKFDFAVTAVNPSFVNSAKDKYIIRLPETYLLLAEAQMKRGKLAEAAASINVLRSRANATPVTAAQITMDYILDERGRELFGEEMRRLTLVRTGTFMDRVVRLNPITGPVFKPFNVLFPIPQTAIDANTGAELKQNPGF